MRRHRINSIFFMFLLLVGLMPGKLIAEDLSFDFVRVLKPYPNPPQSWDPRVSVTGEIVDPETANRLDYFHWSKNTDDMSVVQFYYSVDFPTYILNIPGLIQCITDSAETWQDIPTANLDMQVVSGIDFPYFDNPYINDPPWIVDGQNIVSFCYNNEIIGFNDYEVIGKTFITWDSGDADCDGDTNELIDCDIILNACEFDSGGHYVWTVGQMNYATYEIDVQSVVTHEMGHVLGLAHPYTREQTGTIYDDTCPTMYAIIEPAFDDNLEMRSLEDYDINCATFLYPSLADGNDTWDVATEITGSEAGVAYNDLAITEDDYDWYKIWLDQYDTVKVKIEEPAATNDIKLYLTLTPSIFDPDDSNGTNNVEVYTGAELKYKSTYTYHYHQVVYAHTVMIPGEYYILAKGRYTSSESDYTLTAYISNDGDGNETSVNQTLPIPTGDGIPDAWEIENGLNPVDINDVNEDPDFDDLSSMQEYNINTLPQNDDSDSDGMKDGWEHYNTLNPLFDDASLDPDNDGMTNLEEFIADTNPLDSNSVIAVRNLIIEYVETGFGDETSGIMINWENIMAFTFEILYSSAPEGPFFLMEEFEPGNELETGLTNDNFTDIGYPEPPDSNAGTIRPAPLSSDVNSRYYKVRKKTE